MTEEKIREIVEHYNTCKKCGKEFQVYKADDPQEFCYGCQTNAAVGAAKEKLLPLIGAKITCVEPVHQGSYTSDDEIEFIEIKLATVDRRILLSVAGWEDHYIQWEIVKP